MNVIEICQRIHREAGFSGTGPTSLSGNVGQHQHVVDWLQQVWIELQNEHPWKWMRKTKQFTLTSGKGNYTLADLTLRSTDDEKNALGRWYMKRAHIWKTSEGYDSHGWLRFLSREQWNYHYRYRSVSDDTPQFWTILDDRSVQLVPAPSSSDWTVALDYFRRPYKWKEDTTDDSAVPDLPEEYHMLLVWLALRNETIHDEALNVYNHAQDQIGILKPALRTEWLFSDEESPVLSVASTPLA